MVLIVLYLDVFLQSAFVCLYEGALWYPAFGNFVQFFVWKVFLVELDFKIVCMACELSET